MQVFLLHNHPYFWLPQQQGSRSQHTLVSQVPYVPNQQLNSADYMNQYDGHSRY